MVDGLYGAVLQRGASEAGVIFVVINHLDHRFELLGPTPGAAFNSDGDRQFVIEGAGSESEVNAILARRKKFDPDLWIVEIEDRHGLAGLSVISSE